VGGGRAQHHGGKGQQVEVFQRFHAGKSFRQ
jgi:hypothetical protein